MILKSFEFGPTFGNPKRDGTSTVDIYNMLKNSASSRL